MAFASVPDENWVATNGADRIGKVRSSSFGHRAFCRDCGTPLYMRVNHQPETVDFSIVTLDDPSVIAPEFHIFWASRVPWFPEGDGLPKHDRFRPGTRGLEGTEPPEG
jgi:hypothetical protein